MKRSLTLLPVLLAFAVHTGLMAQETLWGLTANGGQSNAGSIYTMTTAGVFTRKYDFVLNEGVTQRSDLTKASNGLYYGVTAGGGTSGLGTLFSYDPGTGVYSVLYSMTSLGGSTPDRGVVQASNGILYGVCRTGGLNAKGTIYEYNITTSTFTKRFDFNGTNGQTPRGRMVEISGKLYGVTQQGGTNGVGAVFDFTLATNAYAKRFNMALATGGGPGSGMILASDGLLYGTTQNGGANSFGAIYSFHPTTFAFSLRHSLTTAGSPFAEMVQAANGKLYGTTPIGGANGVGGIFSFDIVTDSFVKLYSCVSATGKTLYGRMMEASNGLLYGMTSAGGTNDKGVLYSFDTGTDTYTLLLHLNPNNAGAPYAGLMEDPVGSLNGTCGEGGSFSLGGLFRYSIAGATLTQLAAMGASNGAYPWGRLTRASNGLFYGLTSGGGSTNSGVLFSFDPTTSTYVKLVDLNSTNGRFPFGRMALVGNTLYGLCSQGGTFNGGTLFSYDIGTAVFTVKVNLQTSTGTGPQAGMIVASNGRLYGTCAEGGTSGYGTIFQYIPGTNTYTVLRHLFSVDGSTPIGDLLQASNGLLYGTLSEAGTFSGGSVYRIDPATNVFTRIADFDPNYGIAPCGDLSESGGKLFGTTREAGLNGNGTIFSFVISTGVLTDVHDFINTEGSASESGMLLASDGMMYATCVAGGASSIGTVIRFDPTTNGVVVLRSFALADGFYPHDGLVKETIPPAGSVQLSLRMKLEGPLNTGSGIMADSLRTLAGFPLTEPYTTLGFAQAGGGGGETTTAPVLAVTGNNAIVDWVRIELRSSSDPASITATKQCLVQRDGDVVSTDGVSAVTMGVAPGNYYVAVRHRNHLGCMTAAATALSASPASIDFTLASTLTYGTSARKTIGAVEALYAGNTVYDTPLPYLLKYTGSNNDRDLILTAIGGIVPTATITGYRIEDVNLDGIVKYTGSANDRDPILTNIGGVVPTSTRAEQLP